MGKRRMGNVHLRGETAVLEEVRLTPEQNDLILRRISWILRDYIAFDRSLRNALKNAYIAGLNDAAQVIYGQEH